MSISIEVIYARPQRQERVHLDMPADSTALDAVEASGLLPDRRLGPIGVWGKIVDPGTRLRDGDRVEIYRPLIADPKAVRRERAAKTGK